MTMRTGGQLLAETLHTAGVTEVFSLHGGHLDAFLIACAGCGIRLTDTRHEASAGHAAEAYARATARIGVAVVTAGPGFTNAYTAIANAYLDRMPVLFIIGAPSSREADLNTLQGGIDQIAAAGPVSKWAFRITSGTRLPEIVEQAIRRALTGVPGPVVLEIPIEVMFTPVAEPRRTAALINFDIEDGPAPAPLQVQAMLDMLQSAARPVIMAGGGATLSRSGALLQQFAELTGIPVTSGMKAEGILPQDHPLYAGGAVSVAIAGMMGPPTDAVVLLGLRIGLFTGGRYGLIPHTARVAQVDIDGAEPGRGGPIDIPVMADCRQTLLAMLDAARQRDWPDRSVWAQMLQVARNAPHQRWADVPAVGAAGTLHPFHAARAMVEAIPEDAVIICDGGESSIWMRDHIRPRGAGAFLITGYLGTLGVGQGFAIGAARAFPGRPVVLFAGDGGVGFHIQEFDTMVRHDLPILTVVLNNACWAMSQNGQDLVFGRERRAIVTLRDTNYDKVCEAFGGYGARVMRLEDIGPAIHAALASGKPSCVNVIIDGSVVNPVTLAMIGIKEPALAAKGDLPAKQPVIMPYYDNVSEPAS